MMASLTGRKRIILVMTTTERVEVDFSPQIDYSMDKIAYQLIHGLLINDRNTIMVDFSSRHQVVR